MQTNPAVEQNKTLNGPKSETGMSRNGAHGWRRKNRSVGRDFSAQLRSHGLVRMNKENDGSQLTIYVVEQQLMHLICETPAVVAGKVDVAYRANLTDK